MARLSPPGRPALKGEREAPAGGDGWPGDGAGSGLAGSPLAPWLRTGRRERAWPPVRGCGPREERGCRCPGACLP